MDDAGPVLGDWGGGDFCEKSVFDDGCRDTGSERAGWGTYIWWQAIKPSNAKECWRLSKVD